VKRIQASATWGTPVKEFSQGKGNGPRSRGKKTAGGKKCHEGGLDIKLQEVLLKGDGGENWGNKFEE